MLLKYTLPNHVGVCVCFYVIVYVCVRVFFIPQVFNDCVLLLISFPVFAFQLNELIKNNLNKK